MIIEVTNERLDKVNFAPSDELVEIAQNVKTILTTLQGEVPLDRKFGLVPELVDAPINVLQAKLTARIVEAVNKFEPRAKVTDVFFGGQTANGEALITVRLRLT